MLHFDKGEKVIGEARRHWFVILAHAAFVVILGVVPAIGFLVIENLYSISSYINLPGSPFYLGTFLYLIWLLFLWIAFFIEWTNYYLDVWYITNKKIIDIEQKRLFHREVITLRYEQIQDITIETKGIIATVFGFGNLHVQTAGESREIVLPSARNPEKLKKLILAQQSIVIERPKQVRVVE